MFGLILLGVPGFELRIHLTISELTGTVTASAVLAGYVEPNENLVRVVLDATVSAFLTVDFRS